MKFKFIEVQESKVAKGYLYEADFKSAEDAALWILEKSTIYEEVHEINLIDTINRSSDSKDNTSIKLSKNISKTELLRELKKREIDMISVSGKINEETVSIFISFYNSTLKIVTTNKSSLVRNQLEKLFFN